MAVTKQKKNEILSELIVQFKSAKSVAVGKAFGMSVKESSDFRGQLRSENVAFRIAKKTLICLAAKEAGYEEIDKKLLDGSVGVAFSPDEISASKLVKKFDPKGEKMALIGVFYGGKFMKMKEANEFASIKSREELLSQFVGMLRSPLYAFAGILNTPLGSFARATKAYGDKKQ